MISVALNVGEGADDLLQPDDSGIAIEIRHPITTIMRNLRFIFQPPTCFELYAYYEMLILEV